MIRSGYVDDMDDQWALIRWRGAVMSAIRGKRGQAFLREMLTALDALPEKRLISQELEQDGEVCAIGSVAKLRGMDVSTIDPECPDQVAGAFGVSEALVREIEYENDDDCCWSNITPEARYEHMRKWVNAHIQPSKEKP